MNPNIIKVIRMDVVCPFCIERHIGVHFVALILFVKTDARIFSFSLRLHPINIVIENKFEIWSPNMWRPHFFNCHYCNDWISLSTKLCWVIKIGTCISNSLSPLKCKALCCLTNNYCHILKEGGWNLMGVKFQIVNCI